MVIDLPACSDGLIHFSLPLSVYLVHFTRLRFSRIGKYYRELRMNRVSPSPQFSFCRQLSRTGFWLNGCHGAGGFAGVNKCGDGK